MGGGSLWNEQEEAEDDRHGQEYQNFHGAFPFVMAPEVAQILVTA